MKNIKVRKIENLTKEQLAEEYAKLREFAVSAAYAECDAAGQHFTYKLRDYLTESVMILPELKNIMK
jgi:hypothetical protein